MTQENLPPANPARFKPVTHVALDIVDNCNLRCPFCLYDYREVRKTNVMSKATFKAAMRLLPLVGSGHFWLSCFHEPTLHPEFLEMLALIPDAYRSNVFFTTNLAKRMPDDYFVALAHSGINHINISVESLDPTIYERMRKGARHHIFGENWEKLLSAFARTEAPPRPRYIVMAYKSNLREIPDLIGHLIRECRAWNVEVRDTYDVPHLPPEFRDAEFLDIIEWRWLHRELSGYRVQDVMMSLPPWFTPEPPAAAAGEQPATQAAGSNSLDVVGNGCLTSTAELARARATAIPGLFEIKMSWDGAMAISPALAGDYPSERHNTIHANIADIVDPVEFFLSKARAPTGVLALDG